MATLRLLALCFLLQLLLASSQSGDSLVWMPASNPDAVCNDFTRAGFFIRRNTSSDDWVIYLESGSLCFSNDTCNRRFFRSEVR